ncbi:MAG: Uma2 family endonuclease [Thermomicrobiales bacterium]
MALTKLAGTWKYEDLFELPDDGTRCEIIDGGLYEMPSLDVGARHCRIAGLITLLIPVLQRLGAQWRTAPLDVFFAGADPVQPDILVLLPGSAAHPVRHGVEGPPDLLIEVLSPPTAPMTRSASARSMLAGVREYWIVDPDAATIEIIDHGGETVQHVVAAESDILTLRSPLLGDLAANPASLFPADTAE